MSELTILVDDSSLSDYDYEILAVLDVANAPMSTSQVAARCTANTYGNHNQRIRSGAFGSWLSTLRDKGLVALSLTSPRMWTLTAAKRKAGK